MYILQTGNDGGAAAVFFLISIGLKIMGLFYCRDKAKELNRNIGGWATFGFLSPILAMIWISCMKPIIKWEENKSI